MKLGVGNEKKALPVLLGSGTESQIQIWSSRLLRINNLLASLISYSLRIFEHIILLFCPANVRGKLDKAWSTVNAQ